MKHGQAKSYKHAGCSCDACRDANALYERRRRKEAELGRPRTVPSIGTQRRVRALQRLGWPTRVIAREAGWERSADAAIRYALTHDMCHRDTARRIAAVYERLSMTLPPYSSGSVRARKHAERAGYLPPLMWDDDRIDDPSYNPVTKVTHSINSGRDIDEAVILRVLDGENLPTNKAERAEIMRRWVARGGSQAEMCRRMGWREGRYGSRIVGLSAQPDGTDREAC